MSHPASRVLALGAIALSSLTLSGCFTEEIDARQTQEIQGLVYKIHEKEPFTGRILGYPMSVMGMFSVGSCNVDIKKGLPHGETRCTDNAGNLLGVGEFEAGKRHGVEEKYDVKTASKTQVNHWKNGQLDGKQEQFNPQNGALIVETHYRAGQKDGSEKLWDASGKILITSLDWKNGLQSGFDNRNDQRRNLLDGKDHGTQQYYSGYGDSSYLRKEDNYANGKRQGVQKEFDPQGNVTQEDVYENGLIQSRTLDEYKDKQHVRHVSLVQTEDEPDSWDADESLANNGTEQRWNNAGQLTHELEWNRGKLVKATRSIWLNGKVDSQYQGVGQDGYQVNQRVLKQGVERIFDDQGDLLAHIQWNNGKVVSAAVQLPPSVRDQRPGKMAVLDSRMLDYFASPLITEADFFGNSAYREVFGTQFNTFIDIPTAQQSLVQAAQGKSQAEVDTCVQQQIDTIRAAEGEDYMIRHDMIEEIEGECRG